MASDVHADIAGQAVRGSFYSVGAAGVTITLGFARAVLLARLLLPDHFGVVALALFFVNLSAQFRALGLDRALLHRQASSGPVCQTYLTLKLLLVGGTTLLLILLAPVVARFYPGQPLLAPVMTVLGLIAFLGAVNQAQETLLGMTLNFKRLAFVNVASSVVMTVVAPWLAWQGWGVWSLVGMEGIGQPQPWTVAALKAGAFALPFCVLIVAFERYELAQMTCIAWASLRGGWRPALGEG